MQIAIVGGGIVGLASAYYLSKRDVDVTVLEKGSLGSGSTDRANGGIRAHFSSPVSSKLSQRSIEVWESIETEFDTDIEFRRPGYLFMARTEETAERFRENVRKQEELGVESEFVSPERASEICPELHADRFLGGAYSPNDGIADPHLGLQAFSIAANEAGVDIRTGVEVTDITLDGNGSVTGVETSKGSIEVDTVVNAAGPWAAEIAEMAGLNVPVTPKRRKLVIVDPETPVPESTPFTIDADRSVHFRPEREGNVVAGGHFAEADPAQDPDDFEERVPLEWSAQVVEAASDTAGYFGPHSEIRRAWAGLYAVTPDHHPIIEETRPGFVNAIGFSGHGFMQSPATGQLVAELVVDGEATSIDISSLTSDRFEGGSPLSEGTVID
ncbi:NAD(P)/FAD-dependent oxidoreductase [Halobacterium sp. KA-6]|uniref:NAD(P)/FAD-dependent oxidoreductase n=1 Tax=Halobacterium sp. KA-6 TaxID=2896368 RepID=UPI001E2D4B64|nr:FAD-dependent oxidoreductase [Halobacterium sp. KA-6]MCD2204599.1 FAD-binding oxidoreductase [Halobacterium sp. KA-6]